MRGAARVTLAWGLLLAALTCVQLAFFVSTTELALLGGAASFMLVLAALMLIPGRRRALLSLPDLSWATVATIVGAGLACAGVAVGSWLFLPGLGLLVVGLGGVGRELLAQRRGA